MRYQITIGKEDMVLTRPFFALLILCGLQPFSIAAEETRICSITNVEACSSTNRLVWDDAFIQKLRQYIGDRPAGWLYEDGTMSGQMIDVLGGQDNERVTFGDNLIRFSACRYHSCPEKGAVIVTTDGEIKAFAIIHFNVSDGYTEDPLLTILTRHKGDDFSIIENHIVDWYTQVFEYHFISLKRYDSPTINYYINNITKHEVIHLE